MSVDLPAPLSPTRAVTLPGRTTRSTPLRTLTGPKDFLMPTSWMIGSASLPTEAWTMGGEMVPDMLAALRDSGPGSRCMRWRRACRRDALAVRTGPYLVTPYWSHAALTSAVQTSSYDASPAAMTSLTLSGPTSCGVTWMYGVP